jgi:2-desacetyl-2-hydroxyethyl bacteriochlorophyllide A dehydrogenase
MNGCTMRAAVYRGSQVIAVEDVPVPSLDDTDFLVKVQACGICGSDLHAYGAGWVPDGHVMGHEYAGVVVAGGAAVRSVSVGQRVAVIPLLSCGQCRYCGRGCENLCERPRGFAGGLADYVRLQNGVITYILPDDVSTEEGAFLEPLSVAVRAVRRGGHPLGEPVVVVGLGTVGQLVVQVLKAYGARCVIGVDLSESRRRTAERVGAAFTLDPSSVDVVEVLRSRLGGGEHRGYRFANVPTVFECSGASRVLDEVVTGVIRVSGTVVIAALCESDVEFDINPLVRKEVSLRGSYAYARNDIAEAFDLLRQRRVDVAALITHRVPLEHVDAAFAIQADKDTSVKVLVVPSPDTVGPGSARR